jgi:hypothetical protein
MSGVVMPSSFNFGGIWCDSLIAVLRIRRIMFLGLPDPWWFWRKEKYRKISISSVLWLANYLQKKSHLLLASWKPLKKIARSVYVIQWNWSAEPDPYQNVTDPEQWLIVDFLSDGFWSLSKCEQFISVRQMRPNWRLFYWWTSTLW